MYGLHNSSASCYCGENPDPLSALIDRAEEQGGVISYQNVLYTFHGIAYNLEMLDEVLSLLDEHGVRVVKEFPLYSRQPNRCGRVGMLKPVHLQTFSRGAWA